MNILPPVTGYRLPARVLALFESDPSLRLSHAEITRLMTAWRRTVTDVLTDHVKAGRLARHGSRGNYTYSLAPPKVAMPQMRVHRQDARVMAL